MRIRILERAENKVVVEIHGEDHTLGNLLEKILLNDPRVDFASYENPHPLEEKIVVTIVTRDNADPIAVLKDATAKIIDLASEFKKKLLDAYREAGLEVEA